MRRVHQRAEAGAPNRPERTTSNWTDTLRLSCCPLQCRPAPRPAQSVRRCAATDRLRKTRRTGPNWRRARQSWCGEASSKRLAARHHHHRLQRRRTGSRTDCRACAGTSPAKTATAAAAGADVGSAAADAACAATAVGCADGRADWAAAPGAPEACWKAYHTKYQKWGLRSNCAFGLGNVCSSFHCCAEAAAGNRHLRSGSNRHCHYRRSEHHRARRHRRVHASGGRSCDGRRSALLCLCHAFDRTQPTRLRRTSAAAAPARPPSSVGGGRGRGWGWRAATVDPETPGAGGSRGAAVAAAAASTAAQGPASAARDWAGRSGGGHGRARPAECRTMSGGSGGERGRWAAKRRAAFGSRRRLSAAPNTRAAATARFAVESKAVAETAVIEVAGAVGGGGSGKGAHRMERWTLGWVERERAAAEQQNMAVVEAATLEAVAAGFGRQPTPAPLPRPLRATHCAVRCASPPHSKPETAQTAPEVAAVKGSLPPVEEETRAWHCHRRSQRERW
jgi:hypothetical protein